MRRWVVVIGGVLVWWTVSWLAAGLVFGWISRPERWTFPVGFRGWVLVRYQDPSCPPLPTDGLYRVIAVDLSGRACTSSPAARGWHVEQFTFVFPDGRTEAIPAGGDGADRVAAWNIAVSGDYREQYLFVGTKAELDQGWNAAPYP